MQPKTTVWDSQSSLQLWSRFRMSLPVWQSYSFNQKLYIHLERTLCPGSLGILIISTTVLFLWQTYREMYVFVAKSFFVGCLKIWWVKDIHTATYFESSKMSQDHQCKQLQVLGTVVSKVHLDSNCHPLLRDYWSGWLDVRESPKNRSAVI